MKDSTALVLGGVLFLALAYGMFRAGQPGPVSGSTATVRAVFGGQVSCGSWFPIVGIIGGVLLWVGIRTR